MKVLRTNHSQQCRTTMCRKYIQKGYTIAEIVIVFAVIALHVLSMLPGLLRPHKRTAEI